MSDILTLAARVAELDAAATEGPWRYGALEHGGRCVTDGRGYLFAQVDDDGNGRLIAEYRSAAPELAAFVRHVDEVTRRMLDDGEEDAWEQGYNVAANEIRRECGLPPITKESANAE